jgi:hypothetical protein
VQKKIWTEVNFRDWMSRCGLSKKQAAAVLGVTEIMIRRNRNGQTAVKDDVALKAMAYVDGSITTKGPDGELLDSTATLSEIAALCAEFEYSVVTGLTSAILRGWTSANIGQFRQLRQPVRRPTATVWNDLRLEWMPTETLDLIEDVECRLDQDGRPYRIASIERTLVDIAVLFAQGDVTSDDFQEAWMGAFNLSEQAPNLERIRTLADRNGVVGIIEEHI